MKRIFYPLPWKKPVLLALFLFVAAWSSALLAQTVSGKVTDAETGDPLVGATVSETGTRNGTVTDQNGDFSLRLTDPNATLSISYTGFETMSMAVAGRSTLDAALTAGAAIDEVVVTALGIKKDAKKVGYSVTQVDGQSLTQARELNIANSLVGRVAGLNVSSTASGPGGSSRVTLRGNTSISGDNQPLYVINGVPMDNTNLGSAGLWGGADFGDGISSLNADDIETISVLKGATAAALYGSRAKNGVILITTKSGRAQQGIGVEFNSNLTWEQPQILTDWQTEFGQGTLGVKPGTPDEGKNTGLLSWGGRLDGSQAYEFDGAQRAYSAKGNAAEDFYRTGFTHVNTLAIGGGNATANYRLSFGNTGNNSVIPETDLNRKNVNASLNFTTGRLSTDFRANYTKEKANHRPNLSDSPGNANFAINFLPANVDQSLLAGEDGEGSNRVGKELEFNDNQFITNPYFAAYKFINNSNKDRLLGQARVRYDLADWLYVQVRAGQDFYLNRRTVVTPTGTAYNNNGGMNEYSLRFSEVNADLLLGAQHDFNENFGLNVGFGGNRLDRRVEKIEANGGTFVIPYLYALGNLLSRNYAYNLDRVRTNSLYGFAELDLYHQFYLNVTGRNDWYSTLTNPSYFYPSVSASWVFSEALQNDALSYGKLRVAYASVGGDTDPYQTALYYNIGGAVNGYPIGNITNVSLSGLPLIPNKDLKPLSINELEIGTELRFWSNRVGLDLAWYNKKTTNDIVAATISGTSGYGAAVYNLGELTNTGIEALLSVTPLKSRQFGWTSSFNFATNKSEVVQLAEGVNTLQVDGSRTQTAYVHQTIGHAFANIKVFDYKRDASGNILLLNGLPQQADTLISAGSGVHKVTGGWNNEFNFGNLQFGFLFDFKFGGKIFSATNTYAYSRGLHQATLEGREGQIVAAGIDEATGEANAVAVNPQDYYGALSRISSLFVYDASFIKLRQVTLGYNFPRSWFKNTDVQGLNIALVGRNLAILYKKTDNIDPESNYSAGNAQGLELAGLPSVRSFGLNINLKF